MKKIGAIGVGTSPRPSITNQIKSIVGEELEVIEIGILDGFTAEELEKNWKPIGDEDRLLEYLSDGTEVVYAERLVYDILPKHVKTLEAQGVELIVVYCAGKFPEVECSVPIIYPRDVMDGIVPAVLKNRDEPLIVLTPTEEFVPQWTAIWKNVVNNVTVLPLHIKGNDMENSLARFVEKVDKMDAKVIAMDCMGYSAEAKRYLKEHTDKKIIHVVSMLARTIAEVL